MLLLGFRNADIRLAFLGLSDDDAKWRPHSASVGRLLDSLHVRALFAKVPRYRRWRVTQKCQHVLDAIVRLYHDGIPAALCTAA